MLAKRAKIYVLTADTRSRAEQILEKLKAETILLSGDNTSREKVEFIQAIGANRTVAIGNRYNDHLMVKEAALGLCIIGREGPPPPKPLNVPMSSFKTFWTRWIFCSGP